MSGITQGPEGTRQRRLAAARAAGLLPLLERGAYLRDRLRTRRANAAFRAENPGIALPPRWWMRDMYAHTDDALYWHTGQAHARIIDRLFAAVLGRAPGRVAEWGCGMGRVIRHVSGDQVTGYDYNEAAVAWCAEHLAGTFRRNALMPPLPCEDAGHDAVFAISVLTHLSEAAHEAWAAELARIVAPGGVLIVTVHGAPGPGQLLPDEAARFAAGHLVVRGGVKEGSRLYTAYQPDAYMRALFAGFEMDRLDEDGLGQTVWRGVRV